MALLFLIIFLLMNFYETTSHTRISIITSVYDGDQFIENFLNNIVQQTVFDCCELILINANSPGNEESFIKKYQQSYKNIYYEKLDHDPGIYAVWNYAINQSKGEYLVNANLDDRLDPHCYEIYMNILDQYPKIDLVYSDFYITLTPNDTFEKVHQFKRIKKMNFSLQALLIDCLPNNHPMWRKSSHNRFGYFDESYKIAGDWEMWLRAAFDGANFKRIPLPLGIYYKNPYGLSTNQQNSLALQEHSLVKKKYQYLYKQRLVTKNK